MSDSKSVQFVCAACEKEYEGDASEVMTECRVCRRLHCQECVDEYGRCVTCSNQEPSKN